MFQFGKARANLVVHVFLLLCWRDIRLCILPMAIYTQSEQSPCVSMNTGPFTPTCSNCVHENIFTNTIQVTAVAADKKNIPIMMTMQVIALKVTGPTQPTSNNKKGENYSRIIYNLHTERNLQSEVHIFSGDNTCYNSCKDPNIQR